MKSNTFLDASLRTINQEICDAIDEHNQAVFDGNSELVLMIRLSILSMKRQREFILKAMDSKLVTVREQDSPATWVNPAEARCLSSLIIVINELSTDNKQV
jgi:hypothetical protein